MKTKNLQTKTSGSLMTMALSLVLMLTLSSLSGNAQQVSVGDSLALVEIHTSTNGAGWSNASSNHWLTGPVSTWQGVTLSNGRVTELYLPLNNLTGSLNYAIGFLQELKSLRLPGNKLTGNIPAAIVFLQKLETLDFSANQLSGNLPLVMGLLPNLTVLNLSKNKFTGSIPLTIGALHNLRRLDLSSNQLGGAIPSTVGLLSELQSLFLSDNHLQGTIPASMGSLKNVTEVYVNNNQLKGNLPAALGDMEDLVFFSAANNQLTGSVPSTLTQLSSLYLFNISGNKIKDLPDLSGISSLFQLIVANNRLTFADIQPNLSRMLPGSYIPQDSVGNNKVVSVCAGDTLRLNGDVIEASPSNRYIWFTIDGSSVYDESVEADLVIPAVNASHSGTYSVLIYNDQVPDLYLYRKTIAVNVKTCAAKSASNGNTSVYPVPFRDNATLDVKAAAGQPLEVFVRDSNGLVVETHSGKTTSDKVVVGSGLSNGTYYVQTVYGGTKDVVRIQKGQ